ncbi:MAG TPA: hypothetical protein VK846_13065 [Candidatus Limnocylindria bacterium]|nr:hypothetical protein [Candidatus Limnocylindria bacterium]
MDAKPQHEFTAKRGGHVNRCVSYRFEQEHGSYSRYFVFTNEMLAKICARPAFGFERVAGSERPQYGDPEARMATVLSAIDPTGNGLVESIPRFPAQKGSEPMNVLSAFIFTAPLWLMAADEAGYESRLLAQKFNLQRVRIGNRVDEVEAVFGDAALIEPHGDGREFRYYGSIIRGANSVAWMLVVYENGAAVRVFTNDFFDKNKVAEFERARFQRTKSGSAPD